MQLFATRMQLAPKMAIQHSACVHLDSLEMELIAPISMNVYVTQPVIKMHHALTHQDLLFANASKDSLVMVHTARRLKHAITQKIAAPNLQTAFCCLVWFHVSVAKVSLEMEHFAEVIHVIYLLACVQTVPNERV